MVVAKGGAIYLMCSAKDRYTLIEQSSNYRITCMQYSQKNFMRIIGIEQKNNGQNLWEILERIIGKISSIIGVGLPKICILCCNFLVEPIFNSRYQKFRELDIRFIGLICNSHSINYKACDTVPLTMAYIDMIPNKMIASKNYCIRLEFIAATNICEFPESALRRNIYNFKNIFTTKNMKIYMYPKLFAGFNFLLM